MWIWLILTKRGCLMIIMILFLCLKKLFLKITLSHGAKTQKWTNNKNTSWSNNSFLLNTLNLVLLFIKNSDFILFYFIKNSNSDLQFFSVSWVSHVGTKDEALGLCKISEYQRRPHILLCGHPEPRSSKDDRSWVCAEVAEHSTLESFSLERFIYYSLEARRFKPMGSMPGQGHSGCITPQMQRRRWQESARAKHRPTPQVRGSWH